MRTNKTKRALLLSALGLAAGTLVPATGAFAQQAAWPTKPLRILVGFPGGSTPDIAARTIAEPLSRALGQPVVIDNKPGASGNIAADTVAKATDDHTLGVVINGNLTSSKMLYPNLPYDPAKDFTYLSLLTTAPLILVTPANEPSGAAFLDAAKKAGDKWNYGSVGVGSVGHLGMEQLQGRVSGMASQHIPYQGNPQVVTAMIGGQVQMALIPPGVAMPQIKAGKLKAVGLTSGRSTLVPEIPSLGDVGVKDFNLEVWTALLGPANLSKAAQDRIAKELAIIMKDPAVRQRLFDQGWQAVGTSPEGMRTRVKEESAIMSRIISTKGIKLQ
ncbi:tripartite tricarboxylate transporter substrate binding protein [Variovorax sp. OV329]|uniref:Bug family tripartite tricarboxylate transporter substrate binding protein n=1 Tax=Variovorax sp. OV329 TaxID=1882825 RepID=UPI0008E88075|nr:tripartite tricarboxylate transporter substrate binding protein [Variovorax sp. OV329]SFM34278.1 Tripartite-type tricarboxylate transporter, receptor component TctC [Variovorax sp. OV329]